MTIRGSSLACSRVFGASVWFVETQIIGRETQEVIQSLQLIISHHVKSYLSVVTIWGSSLTCSGVFGGISAMWGNWTQSGPKYSKSWWGRHRKQSKVFSSSFHIKFCLTHMQNPSEGSVWPVLGYFGHYGHLGNLCPNRAQIAQIMARETQQVIKSLEFIISHQVRPYLSVMTIWRLSSTCSRLFGALVQFWKLGPKRAQIPEINVRETGSHPKSSSHNFTSSEALVKCDNNLMV